MGAGSTVSFQPQHRELPALAELIAMLQAARDFPQDLNTLLDPLLGLIKPAETVAILLWDHTKGILYPVAARYPNTLAYMGIKFMPGEWLPGKVLEGSQSLLINQPEEFSYLYQSLNPDTLGSINTALGAHQTPRSAIAVALRNQLEIWGILEFANYQSQHSFDEKALENAEMAANLIALRFNPLEINSQIRENTPFSSPNPDVEHAQLEMLNTLEHELRLPLTAIKGFATALLLEEVEWSPEKRQEFLQLIADECDHLETLMGNYLNSAVIELNQIPIETQPVSLPHIADQVAQEIKTRTELHRLLVEFQADFPRVQADPHWLKQVFRNLLDNAIKFSPDGGLVVVRGEVRSTDVVISISDQGMGISPEDLIPLFEKYRRAKSQLNHQIPGSGLGLSISRKIIETHGGHIWAQSMVGEGTTVSFSLPYNPPS